MGSYLRLAFCLVQADSDAGEWGAGEGSRENHFHGLGTANSPQCHLEGLLGKT